MASVTLKKVANEWRARGPVSVVSRGCSMLVNTARATWSIRGKRFGGIPALLDFAYTTCGGVVKPMQVREEVAELLELLWQRRPRSVLEIGTASGGTLFLLTRVAAEDAHLISLDLSAGDFGDGYPRWKMPLYRSFALPGQRLDLVRADSHDPATYQQILDLLGGEQLDFLFIDADHTYDGVKRDFEMYRPLVRDGGIIGFHDIKPSTDPVYGVHRFWNEIKRQQEHREFLHGPPTIFGIGVLLL